MGCLKFNHHINQGFKGLNRALSSQQKEIEMIRRALVEVTHEKDTLGQAVEEWKEKFLEQKQWNEDIAKAEKERARLLQKFGDLPLDHSSDCRDG